MGGLAKVGGFVSPMTSGKGLDAIKNYGKPKDTVVSDETVKEEAPEQAEVIAEAISPYSSKADDKGILTVIRKGADRLEDAEFALDAKTSKVIQKILQALSGNDSSVEAVLKSFFSDESGPISEGQGMGHDGGRTETKEDDNEGGSESAISQEEKHD